MKRIFILLAVVTLAALSSTAFAQRAKDAEILFHRGVQLEEVKGELKEAIAVFEKLLKEFVDVRPIAAQALWRMGNCFEKLGQKESQAAYQRILRDFADQAGIVAQARARLAALGSPGRPAGLAAHRILADATAVGSILSADGRTISQVDLETGDVMQFDIASGQTKRIKNVGPWSQTEQPVDDPVFSRDGKRIADNPEKLSGGKEWRTLLRIRNLDGSGGRTLLSENKYVWPLGWSPDGGSILALLARGQVSGLALISTADGSVRILKTLSDWFSLERTAFSPDGRWISFSLERDDAKSQSDVFLMDADGRNEVVVTGHPAEDHLLDWTPDGKGLIFLSDRSGTWDIWRVPIAEGKPAGEPESLKKDFGYHIWDVLGFAPDGSLYYRIDASFGRLFTGELDIETGKELVSPATVTTRFTSPPTQISWSPDGKELAYISNRGWVGPGNNILMIRSAATGEERLLMPRLRFINQISWAPDSRSIIALGARVKGIAFFRIDATTSEMSQLGGEGVVPRLCPDGKTLLYVKGGPFIIKRNLDTGAESKVVDIKGGSNYSISPDGREISFIDRTDGSVKAIPLDGGEPRLIFKGPAQAGVWTRDGRYFIVLADGNRWRVPAQGGSPLKLNFSIPKMQYFALNPDNRRFVFSVNDESKSELWVLENFLPPAKAVK